MKDFKKRLHTSKMPGAMKDDGSEMGVIKIHENVIASIVRRAACGVNGVVRLAGSTLVDNIAEIIGSRKIGDRAINVNINGDCVAIEVKINIAYGAHVPTVASNVQSTVSEEVEKMTGMTVSAVNVIVQELDDQESVEEHGEN
jgi:uncharacterized alkaline shock family protein YloU